LPNLLIGATGFSETSGALQGAYRLACINTNLRIDWTRREAKAIQRNLQREGRVPVSVLRFGGAHRDAQPHAEKSQSSDRHHHAFLQFHNGIPAPSFPRSDSFALSTFLF
jgi:hypothetical protein